jgi:hypothetical protein
MVAKRGGRRERVSLSRRLPRRPKIRRMRKKQLGKWGGTEGMDAEVIILKMIFWIYCYTHKGELS